MKRMMMRWVEILLHKNSKKEVKSASESAQAFTQFLLTSAATGENYVDVNNCWKRKPKLNYLVLKKDRNKKQKSRVEDIFMTTGPVIENTEEWSIINNDNQTGEEERADNLSETEEVMPPVNLNDDTKFIYKPSCCMDVAE
eukprot:15343182-Ditylum_brightwellii.AAC.1